MSNPSRDEYEMAATLSTRELVGIVLNRFAHTNGAEFLSDKQVIDMYYEFVRIKQERNL